MDIDAAEDVLRAATTQRHTRGALAWLSEGRPIGEVDLHQLIAAIRAIDPAGASGAIRRVTRELLRSAKDSSANLTGLEEVVSGSHIDQVLTRLVSYAPNGRLSGVGSSALASTLTGYPDAVEIYLMCAALTWREARARGSLTRFSGRVVCVDHAAVAAGM